MSKRTNSFPTFTPSTKTNPPTAGFQPANIILSSEVNGAVYMSYNFVNSFVNALIAGGNLDDSSVYAYDETNLKTLITDDFKSWVKNIISQTPTFTTVKCSTNNDSSILYKDSLNFNVALNDYKYETEYTYTLMNFKKKDSSDNLQSTFQFNLDDLTYSFANNTTVSQNYVSVDMIPSSLKEASEMHNLSNVLAKTFSYTSSSTAITENLKNFLNQHQQLNISSIVVKRQVAASLTTLEWIPIIPSRRIGLDYTNFDFYYFDKSAGTWSMTTSIESLYTGGEFTVTVTFC